MALDETEQQSTKKEIKTIHKHTSTRDAASSYTPQIYTSHTNTLHRGVLPLNEITTDRRIRALRGLRKYRAVIRPKHTNAAPRYRQTIGSVAGPAPKPAALAAQSSAAAPPSGGALPNRLDQLSPPRSVRTRLLWL